MRSKCPNEISEMSEAQHHVGDRSASDFNISLLIILTAVSRDRRAMDFIEALGLWRGDRQESAAGSQPGVSITADRDRRQATNTPKLVAPVSICTYYLLESALIY
jgi:hypothetical protein